MHGRLWHRALRLRDTAAVAPLLVVLAGCAMSASEDGAGRVPPDSWISGGQTGSLIPRCGLAPEAIEEGVPASAQGFVLYASECEGALALSQLSLHDAQGHMIAFDSEMLSEGAVLITPHSMLPPGSYRVGGNVTSVSEDDGGLDSPSADAGETDIETVTGGDVLTVAPIAQPALRLGELRQVGDHCGPTFQLEIEPTTQAYASLLALDLQIDGGSIRPFIAYGTLDVENGSARLTLPEDVWLSLYGSEHELTLIGRIAGEAAPLESVTLPFGSTACYASAGAVDGDEEETTAACSITRASRAHAQDNGVAWSWVVLAALLLAVRKRKPPPPISAPGLEVP